LLQLHLLCKGYIFPEVLKHLSKQSKLPHNILILMVCLYDWACLTHCCHSGRQWAHGSLHLFLPHVKKGTAMLAGWPQEVPQQTAHTRTSRMKSGVMPHQMRQLNSRRN